MVFVVGSVVGWLVGKAGGRVGGSASEVGSAAVGGSVVGGPVGRVVRPSVGPRGGGYLLCLIVLGSFFPLGVFKILLGGLGVFGEKRIFGKRGKGALPPGFVG